MEITLSNLRLEYIDYRKLKPLQGDLKFLSDANYAKMKASFEMKGMFLPAFVWEKEGIYFIIDGHGREKLFTKENAQFYRDGKKGYEIPCLVVEAQDEKDAKEKLLLVNSRYQEYEKESEFLENFDDVFLSAVEIPELDVDPTEEIQTGSEDDEVNTEEGLNLNAQSIYELKETVLFERGINEYDIPLFKPEMCGAIPEKIKTYCGDGHTLDDWEGFYFFLHGAYHSEKLNCSQGILGFYSWDDRFEGIWKKTSDLVKRIQLRDYLAALSPNFTFLPDDPIAWQIWQVYRARWIGRYMQEAGIMVIPDVMWGDERSFKFSFLGIPQNVPCLAIQTQNIDLSSTFAKNIYEKGFKELLKLEPQSLFIYGSNSTKSYVFSLVPDNLKVIFCESWMGLRREKLKGD